MTGTSNNDESSVLELRYWIPFVHKSVTEVFMKRVLGDFFYQNTFQGANDSLPKTFDCCKVYRITFVPIEGKPHLKEAFVTHIPLSSADYNHHQERLSCTRWYNNYPTSMNLVERITDDISKSEMRHNPVKVQYFHNGRQYFWKLLPYRSPQVKMTEKKKNCVNHRDFNDPEEIDDIFSELLKLKSNVMKKREMNSK